MPERVAFYSHHEDINFSVICEKQYGDASSSYYLTALYIYLSIQLTRHEIKKNMQTYLYILRLIFTQ